MTLALLLTFFAASMVVLGVASMLQRNPVRSRLAQLRGAGTAAVSDSGGIIASDNPGPIGQALSLLAGRNVDTTKESFVKIRRRLLYAGYRRPYALRVYLGLRIALAVALPLLLWNSPPGEGLDPARFTLMLMLAAMIGYIAPSFLLDRRIASRRLRIWQGLPDALDLMVVCIEAGLGLTAAIARVSNEYARSNAALAEEFELVALEAQAGKSTVDALRGLANRTDLTEVGALVAMLVQTERFGTSVANALRVHSDAMRVRRLQIAEEGAAKATLKMLFPAGLFIFPAILLLLAGPGVMKLLETLTGNS
jgi:tight adherence protein C